MMRPLPVTECLSRLCCDQLLNGERDDRAELEAHAATCARCSARLAEHRRERAAFALPLPRGLARRRDRRWWIAAAAAAAAIAVWLVGSPRRDELRSKGGPVL